MSRTAAALLALLLAVAAAGGARAAAAPAVPLPAEWRSFDLLVQFHALPRSYSCDELWYKFRDVLLKLGARAYMTITPYHCGFTGGGRATSPSVELEFQLPRLLSGPDTRYAQISVVDQRVRLAPGSPRTIGDEDCELVRQLRATLFAGLPLHITTADFSCTVAPQAFALNVQAPIAARRQAVAQFR